MSYKGNFRYEPAAVIRQTRRSSSRCLDHAYFLLKCDRVAFVGWDLSDGCSRFAALSVEPNEKKASPMSCNAIAVDRSAEVANDKDIQLAFLAQLT
jgi:hypothetical protein